MTKEIPETAIRRAVRICGSQQRLAEAVGVTQSLVSQWLNGATIHQRHYEAIERASGVSVRELLDHDLARLRAQRQPLLESTQTLLNKAATEMSLRQIAPDGGPVEYEWLKKFSAGKIDHPSVNRIQALHDRLVELSRSQVA